MDAWMGRLSISLFKDSWESGVRITLVGSRFFSILHNIRTMRARRCIPSLLIIPVR